MITLAALTLACLGADDPLARSDCLVGVYYFAGWWREQPNKWTIGGKDWRPDYPGRVPLLGEYNDQETMDGEIAAAAKYGVDFFQILWYPVDPQKPPEPQAARLNDGLRTFLASPNARLIKFTIEAVNHAPFSIPTDEGWEDACREWVAAMKHAGYLRVGGRPVFKMHTISGFYEQCGRDQSLVERRLRTLRRMARAAGVGNPLIGGGVYGGGADPSSAAPYDFLSSYMELPNLPNREKPYPYETLIAHAESLWRSYAKATDKPYVPYVPAGWDPRPWKDPRCSFNLPTRGEWVDALARAGKALGADPKLGLPGRKALLIHAWNEFGEGGIVAPTKGDGYMKLEGIRAAFRDR